MVTRPQEAIPTAPFRAYALLLGGAGLSLMLAALPHIGRLDARYWALFVPGALGAGLSIPLSRSVLLSLHMPPALAAVWAFGWQAGPPVHLSVALILWRAGRLDPWRAAVFFGNTAVGTTLAGILAQTLAGPLRPTISWTEPLVLLGCGALACVLNVVVFLVGQWLDNEPLSRDQVTRALGFLLVTALPLSHLMAVAALTSLAAYALTVTVWVVMGLAVKGFAEGHEARERLQQATEELRELAGTDPLTGLQNRRRFLDVFRHEVLRHARDGTRLSVLLVDVRGLKQVNDARGHPAGDELLRQVASTLRGRLRATDGTFRIGGDEFAVLLPNTDLDGAATVAQALRTALASKGIAVTLGVATFPRHGGRPEDLLSAADRALYAARRAGRDVGIAHVRSPARRERRTG
jgi:diguanylate cyclase (GGDEF)-like protein